MDAQRTPDELTAENELICEKLLGWEVRPRFGNNPCGLFFPDGRIANGLYSFTTWAEAGLILEALSSHCPTLEYSDGKWDCYGGDPFESFFHAYADTAPLAIRAAALEHIRRQP
jgi:hypothetical protein